MSSQDTVQRVRFFDRQLLQVKDFTDEQSYHIRMRRLHNRFLHSYGVLDGLELQLDPHGRKLTVEEGIALDEQGREIVLPHQEQAIDLAPYAGKTLYVTIGYAERDVAPGAAPGAQGFPRVEEYPQVVLTETPPRAGEVLILGRVVVGDDGAATAQDDGVLPYQRRNSGGAGGDLEGRTLTLSGAGSATEWPRLRMSESRTVALEGGLRASGDLRVAGRASVAVELGVGTDTPRARLHVQHVPQDSGGDALVVGPVEGANLRLGHHHNYSWMQSHGGKPLRINEIGNDVSIAGGGNGRVGIGTHEPAQALHVASASDEVGLFQSRGSSASVSLATRDGMDHQVQLANRAGGRLSLWVSGGGDVVNVTRDGRVGVGTEYPAGRFHVRADDRVGLFESIGEHAYLRLATREGDASGVQLAAHPGGRLALGTADAAEAVSITRDGQVGIGTAEPQARLHVAGDLVVDGEIRSLRGGDEAQRWTARPNGLVFEGAVGIGTADPEAKLQVIHTPQDSNGDALVLGPEGASNLRMGYHADYSWMQSHGGKPLRINELGNDLVLNLGGGNVGVGTAQPQARFHVRGDVFVEGTIRTAAGELTPGGGTTTAVPAGGDTLRVPRMLSVGPTAFPEAEGRLHLSGQTAELSLLDRSTTEFASKAGQRYVWYVNEGRARLWTEERGDLLSVGADGRMAVAGSADFGTRTRQMLNLWTEEYGIGIQSGTQYFRAGGNFAWFRGGGHADGTFDPGGGSVQMVLSTEGHLGIGTAAPKARLHVAGDVVVEGTIRTAAGELTPGGGISGPGATVDGAPAGNFVLGDKHGERFLLHGRPGNAGDFFQLAGDDAAGSWNWKTGITFRRGGNVGIGTTDPQARLQVAEGALMPSAGNGEQSGILFPPDAGGGAGDRAWMRYYARAGEAMTLELGTSNDADDHIALMPTGNAGVGVNAPSHRLHVRGTDAIALFESTGKMAYIRLAANGKVEDRVELCNRGDGQLALWVPKGTDSLVIGSDGRMVLGRNQDPGTRLKPHGDIDLRGETVFTGLDGNPGAKVRILGDVVVEGSIRTPKGELVPGGGGAPATVSGTTLQVPRMLTVGPTAIPEAEGRLHLSGPTAELSLLDRSTKAFASKAGQRYVWYVNEGRTRLWTEERGDLFSVNRDGGVAVGPNPAGDDRLEVHGRVRMLTDSNPIRFTSGWTGFPDAVTNQAEISNDTGDYKTLMIVGNSARGDGKRTVGIWDHLNVNGTLEVTQNVVIKGVLTVEGGLKVGGPKGGYLADQFVNLTGDTLEEGDVVVIGESQATLFYGERGNIPIPEVDLTEMVMDRRVCGIVAQAHDGDETEGMEPVSTGRERRGAGADVGSAGESDDPRQVAAGQRGMMVTMGAFAHCKVDADLGAIEVGDLLTTSSTKGHAQKVDDPSLAVGAIIGKALAPLKNGRGKIPVMVMLH